MDDCPDHGIGVTAFRAEIMDHAIRQRSFPQFRPIVPCRWRMERGRPGKRAGKWHARKRVVRPEAFRAGRGGGVPRKPIRAAPGEGCARTGRIRGQAGFHLFFHVDPMLAERQFAGIFIPILR
jgi:hypothetical protein